MRKLASPPFATPIPDAVLVNGRGGETMTALSVRANTTYRVRVINAGAVSLFRLAVEQQNVTVVEADAHGVVPFETAAVEIDAGQRYVLLLRTGDMQGDAPHWSERSRNIIVAIDRHAKAPAPRRPRSAGPASPRWAQSDGEQ
jgi:FtsP/CotA-like multicopper oxidase with cupredoxin domain